MHSDVHIVTRTQVCTVCVYNKKKKRKKKGFKGASVVWPQGQKGTGVEQVLTAGSGQSLFYLFVCYLFNMCPSIYLFCLYLVLFVFLLSPHPQHATTHTGGGLIMWV